MGREKRGFLGNQPESENLFESSPPTKRSLVAARAHTSHSASHVTKLTRADSSRTRTAEICRKEAFGG